MRSKVSTTVLNGPLGCSLQSPWYQRQNSRCCSLTCLAVTSPPFLTRARCRSSPARLRWLQDRGEPGTSCHLCFQRCRAALAARFFRRYLEGCPCLEGPPPV